MNIYTDDAELKNHKTITIIRKRDSVVEVLRSDLRKKGELATDNFGRLYKIVMGIKKYKSLSN